jgi:hypothetical protein
MILPFGEEGSPELGRHHKVHLPVIQGRVSPARMGSRFPTYSKLSGRSSDFVETEMGDSPSFL